MRPQPNFTRFDVGAAGQSTSIHRFSHAAMNTIFEVHCAGADAGYAGQAAQAAFDLVDRLEQELSRFVANSDISRINALAAGESTRVTPWTLECLQLARTLHEVSGGVFDVSVGTGLDRLELLPEDSVVRAREAGARLDLGGIGKGYAVDRVAELLAEWDLAQVLVHGGFSSVLALEPPPGTEGWPLTISAPGTSEVLARLIARRAALSASGVQKGAHVVDPRSGAPVRDRAAWVALDVERIEPPDARRSAAALAEGLSTAFMILDEPEIQTVCAAVPGLEAWVLTDPGRPEAPASLLHLAGAFDT